MIRTTRAGAAAAAAAAARAESDGFGSKQENGSNAHSRPTAVTDADDENADARRAQTSSVRDWRPRMLACLVCAQLLLALTPGLYRSTDFEVHRNWLATTSSLPLRDWYRDATSPAATLDYPPLFAWFERALAALAVAVLPTALARDTLRLQAEPHASAGCVLFQRLTVVATGLALAGAAWWAGGGGGQSSGGKKSGDGDNNNAAAAAAAALRKNLIFFLIACDAGLLLVDHVHFQYNGWLLALLLASILLVERGGGVGGGNDDGDEDDGNDGAGAARRTRRPAFFFLASVAFSALLNAKHLFAHAAPAFFVYLLRGYVLQPAPGGGKERTTTRTKTIAAALSRLALLAAAVVGVFGASLGPFYTAGALPDLAARLFPFRRGLLHSYWAPNAWALYAALDKALERALPSVLVGAATARKRAAVVVGRMSGGLVGVGEFSALPPAGPRAAAAATLLSMLPSLAALWRRPDPRRFAAAVAHGCLCGFAFGYHVHEKAALAFLVPMALLAARPGGGHNGGGGGGGGGGEDGGSGGGWWGESGEDEAPGRTGAAARNSDDKGGSRRRQEEEERQRGAARRERAREGRARADADAAVDFLLASTAGHVGIHPLLFRPQEAALRWASTAFYFAAAAWGLWTQQQQQQQQQRELLTATATQQQRQRQRQPERQQDNGGETTRPGSTDGGREVRAPVLCGGGSLWRARLSYGGGPGGWRLACAYAAGCAALEAFKGALAPALFPNLPFLPLLLTSVWCAWPIVLVWARTTALWAVEAFYSD